MKFQCTIAARFLLIGLLALCAAGCAHQRYGNAGAAGDSSIGGSMTGSEAGESSPPAQPDYRDVISSPGEF